MADISARAHKAATILVVEDSPTQLEQLRFLLEEAGFSVVAATNGKEGFAAAKAKPIDLVISDIVMPEIDGYAFCKALRADKTLEHLPVILLTSLADPRDVIHGLESGANNFICKPYDDSALLARVQNVMANQEIRKATPSEMGINIFFAGQRFFITADRLQILDLLLSTYENAVNRNSELVRARDEMRILNEQLEQRVAERTVALTAEIEERKRAEARIAEQKATLDAILESADQPVFSLDRQYRYKRFNRAHAAVMKAIYGTDIQIGQSLAKYQTVPEDWQAARGNLDRALQGETVLESAPTGDEALSRRYFEVAHHPIRTDAGEIVGVSVFARDITERKRTEEALAASEARYRSYVDATGQSGWVTNPDGEVVEDVPSLRRFNGQTYEEAKGSGWTNALHPDDLERTLQAWNSAVATKSPFEIEYRMRRHDGVYRYLLARGVPVSKADGSIREWVGTCIDITERKRAEEDRAQSAKRWQSTFDAIADIVCVLSPAHEFGSPNARVGNESKSRA
jgi:PAS domain S-box-containing protein